MKAVITALILIASFSVVGWGQSQVTVTGEIMNATRGYVAFRLMPWSSSIHYFVPGVTSIAVQEVRCGINATGQVVATTGGGPCLVWGNDVISPANTTYTVILAPNNQVANTIAREHITGTSYDLNNPQFAPIVNLVPQVTSITSPPLNANLVPSADNAFTLGASTRKYANGFFSNLSVDSFNLGSQNVATMSTDTLNAGTLNVASNLNIAGAISVNNTSGNPGDVLRNRMVGGPSQLRFSNLPFFAASDFNFPPQIPQVNLAGGTPATITLTPCPVGFATSNYSMQLTGGVGAAETVSVTGGTCTSGAATGTVQFTPANNHTGAWTIGSATNGVVEAATFAAANPGGVVILPDTLVVGTGAAQAASRPLGTVSASSGYYVGANAGLSTTLNLRNAAGTGTCTITVTGGLITASTCQ